MRQQRACGEPSAMKGKPMAKKSKVRARSAQATNGANGSSGEDMLLAAMARGDGSFETGRFLVTFKEGAAKDAAKSLEARGLRVADARDFKSQAVNVEDVGDAASVMLPEMRV